MGYAFIADNPQVDDWEVSVSVYDMVMAYLRHRCPQAMALCQFTSKRGDPFRLGFQTNSWQHLDAEHATRLADSLTTALASEPERIFTHLTERENKVVRDRLDRLAVFLSQCGGFQIA